MIFVLATLIADLLFILFILYIFDDERKLPKIQRKRYLELREALLQFEDGQKMYAFFCSEDRAIITAKLFLYGRDCNRHFNFSRSFGIDKQDLISYEKTLIALSNIDEDLARDFVGIIIEESDCDYIRINAIPYRFQLL